MYTLTIDKLDSYFKYSYLLDRKYINKYKYLYNISSITLCYIYIAFYSINQFIYKNIFIMLLL